MGFHWRNIAIGIGLALYFTGCASHTSQLETTPPSPPKSVTIEEFALYPFLKMRKIIDKYVYILLGWEYPQDKICLGEIKNKSKIVPPYFDYYIDLKQLLGNYLVLIEPPHQNCDEVIHGSVIVEAVGSEGGRWEGDLESDRYSGTLIGSDEKLSDKYRIMMSLTLSAYPSWEVDSAAQNVIVYRERERSIDLAISFLSFSIGYSRDFTKKDSIIRTLKALADFSLLQLIAQNYTVPYWYLYSYYHLTPNHSLLIAQQGLFEKYYLRYPTRAGVQLGGVIRRVLAKLYQIPRKLLKKRTYWRLNLQSPLVQRPEIADQWVQKVVADAKAHQNYCPPPTREEERKYRKTGICTPILSDEFDPSLEFTPVEQQILEKIVAGLVRDNLITLPRGKGIPLLSSDGRSYKLGKEEHLYILLVKPLAKRLKRLAGRPISSLTEEEKRALIALIITATNPLIPGKEYQRQWQLLK